MGNYRIPLPVNEPVYSYAPGSPERKRLKSTLDEMKSKQVEMPLVIDGQEIRTDKKVKVTAPHDHNLVLGYSYRGGRKETQMAIDAAMKAQKSWAAMPAQQRAAIFLKAADLLAGPYRDMMNAATMLAHSKTAFQAEIDVVCELVDFFRFNAYYMQMISDFQPINPDPMIWNRLDYRPLEGFIFAVTPFNFVSINGNLPTAPAMWGNVSVWKPARSVPYTSHIIMKILMEAGLPAGVINFVTGNSSEIIPPLPPRSQLRSPGARSNIRGRNARQLPGPISPNRSGLR
jgi:1-pyrroline-5-carboxylate dehydrogenase